MLVDDNEIDNFINGKMIEGCNFSDYVYIHTSSKSALEFINNLQRIGDAGRQLSPELILLDINMPIMDGFQFVEEFEKSGVSNIKIVILSSSINAEDEIRSKQYKSVIGYLSKPLTQEALSSIGRQ